MKVRREFAVLATLLGLVAIADFAGRVYAGRDESLREFEAPAVRQMPPPATAAALSARLARWLPETSEGGPGAAVQSRLRLTGVMTGRDGATAVLATVPPEGQPAEIFRVAEGSQVLGWKVVSIAPHSVSLQGDAGTRELLLFERKQPDKTETGSKRVKRGTGGSGGEGGKNDNGGTSGNGDETGKSDKPVAARRQTREE